MTTMPRSSPPAGPPESGRTVHPGPFPCQLCQTRLHVAVPAVENPGAVGGEAPGPAGRRQVDVEDLLEPGGEVRVLHRGEDLDPPVEIAGHHVGRPDVVPDRALPPVAEGEDAGVLQVPPE